MEILVPFLRLIRRDRVKVALSIRELVAETSAFSVKKSANCKAQFYFADSKRLLLVYRVRCGESYSAKNGHKVRVLFDTSRVDKDSSIDSLDVRVSCTCPAFLYWGAQWNLYTRDSLEGQARPMLKAPEKPGKSDFIICKHIKTVSDRIGPYLVRILEKYTGEMAPEIEPTPKTEPNKPKSEPNKPSKPEPKPTKNEVDKLQSIFKAPEKNEPKPSGRTPITTPAQQKSLGEKKPESTKPKEVVPVSKKNEPKKPEPKVTLPIKPEPAPTKKELDKLQSLFTGPAKPAEEPPKEVGRKKTPAPKDNLESKRKSRPGVID